MKAARIRKSRVSAFLVWLAVAGGVEAAQLVSEPSLPVRFKLRNDLEVILAEDSSLPVVSVVVAYRAGSLQETEDRSGLAYLLERLMMDAGGINVAPFQHRNTIIRAGGVLNAEAFEDRMVFYETVPSHLLSLVLWLESERMGSRVISEDGFERARISLLEELRERWSAEPYLASLFALDQFLYADFAYGHPLLGAESDVRRLTLEDVRNFAAVSFVPANAVLVVAGHFDPSKTRDLIVKYFEPIPGGKTLAPPPARNEPWARLSREETYVEPRVSTPAIYLGFRVVSPPFSNDDSVLTILDYVLLRGRTSRLPRRLLNRDNKIAYQLSGGLERRLDRAVYKIFVTASAPMISACQNAIFSELEKLRRNFVPADELARAKTLYRADLTARTSTVSGRAIYLAEEALALALAGRTIDDLTTKEAKNFAISAKDIIGIMNRVFAVENAVVLKITPR